MLQLKNVYLAYTKDYYTLQNINLSLNKGDIGLIVGEQDSGKSSLIRICAGIENPTKGQVKIKGIDAAKVNFKTDVELGYLSIMGSFMEKKTVEKNLEYVLKIRKIDKPTRQSKLNNAYLTYDLNAIKNIKIKDLKLFDRIKVAIARLSLRKLELLLVDDIFENLEAKEAKSLMEYIRDLIERHGMTALISAQNDKIKKYLNCTILKLKYGNLEK